MLGRVHHEFLLWNTCSSSAKRKYNTNLAWLITKQIYSPCVIDWNVLNTLGYAETIEEMLEIKIVEIGGQDEIFTSMAWRRTVGIKEPIYTELYHEFFATYEFDEEAPIGVCQCYLVDYEVVEEKKGRSLDAITLREFISPNERYAGVFEFMVGHYRALLNEAYAPPGYEEQQ
nr:hypothetical protein [Tanacetum cinerariifolium]